MSKQVVSDILFSGKIYADNISVDASVVDALFLNGTEFKKRSLGSMAFEDAGDYLDSIAVTIPTIFTPDTDTINSADPTLSFSLVSQTANRVFAGPTTGAAGTPTFRALVANDIPSTLNATSFTGNVDVTGYTWIKRPSLPGIYFTSTTLTDKSYGLTVKSDGTMINIHSATDVLGGIKNIAQFAGDAGAGAFVIIQDGSGTDISRFSTERLRVNGDVRVEGNGTFANTGAAAQLTASSSTTAYSQIDFTQVGVQKGFIGYGGVTSASQYQNSLYYSVVSGSVHRFLVNTVDVASINNLGLSVTGTGTFSSYVSATDFRTGYGRLRDHVFNGRAAIDIYTVAAVADVTITAGGTTRMHIHESTGLASFYNSLSVTGTGAISSNTTVGGYLTAGGTTITAGYIFQANGAVYGTASAYFVGALTAQGGVYVNAANTYIKSGDGNGYAAYLYGTAGYGEIWSGAWGSETKAARFSTGGSDIYSNLSVTGQQTIVGDYTNSTVFSGASELPGNLIIRNSNTLATRFAKISFQSFYGSAIQNTASIAAYWNPAAGGRMVFGTSSSGSYITSEIMYIDSGAGGLRINSGFNISSPHTGANSERFGLSSSATGQMGVAIGNGAIANYEYCTAVGYQAQAGHASGGYGTSVGMAASSRWQATALGYGTLAVDFGVAVGTSAVAGRGYGIAIGLQATIGTGSAGDGGIALGVGTNVSNQYGIAIGYGAVVAHYQSVAIGQGASTTAANQIMLGHSVNNPMDVYGSRNAFFIGEVSAYQYKVQKLHGSLSPGYISWRTGEGLIINCMNADSATNAFLLYNPEVGVQAYVLSVPKGTNNVVFAGIPSANHSSYAFSERFGANSIITGTYSTAFGNAASSAGTGVAVGYSSTAAAGSTAIGHDANTTNHGTAIGNLSTANAYLGVSIGYFARGNGNNSVALGSETFVNHAGSVALGYQATTTTINQLMIGSSGNILNTYINGNLQITGIFTPGTHTSFVNAPGNYYVSDIYGLSMHSKVGTSANFVVWSPGLYSYIAAGGGATGSGGTDINVQFPYADVYIGTVAAAGAKKLFFGSTLSTWITESSANVFDIYTNSLLKMRVNGASWGGIEVNGNSNFNGVFRVTGSIQATLIGSQSLLDITTLQSITFNNGTKIEQNLPVDYSMKFSYGTGTPLPYTFILRGDNGRADFSHNIQVGTATATAGNITQVRSSGTISNSFVFGTTEQFRWEVASGMKLWCPLANAGAGLYAIEFDSSAGIWFPQLGNGSSTRMLTVSSTGAVSAQAIPTGGSYTFSNGLTNIAGAVTMEGPLTKNTDITIDGYYWFVGDTVADTYFNVDEGFVGALATVMSGPSVNAYSWYEAGGSYFAAGSYGATTTNQGRFELTPSQFLLESKTSTNTGFKILGTGTAFSIKAQTGAGPIYSGGLEIDSSGNVTMPANVNLGDTYSDVHTTKGMMHQEANTYARVTHVPLAATSTDGTTSVPLTRDGAAISGTANRIVIASGKTYAVEAHIVGRTSAGVTRYYKIAYLVSNTGGTTTMVGTHTASTIGDSTTWSISVGVDDTNDCLALAVMGEASTTVKWAANIVMTEVSA